MTTPHTPTMTPEVMKRLAFIRMLHLQGVTQSRQAQPLNCTCILTFHDAVELFLLLAGEYLRVNIPETGKFDNRYFDHLAKHPRGQLSGRKGVRRLNDHRNNFKHAHAWPSQDAINDARTDTIAFFEDNTPRVFGVPYEAIEMTDLVLQEGARDTLKQASTKAAQGENIQAMGLLVEAFDELVTPLQRTWGDGPFDFGPSLRRRWSSFRIDVERTFRHLKDSKSSYVRLDSQDQNVAKAIGDTVAAARAMQAALRVMAIGIEYQKYVRFQDLTPAVRYDLQNEHRYEHRDFYAPTREEFEYCQNFVIEVALRLAEIRSEAAKPSWMPGELWWGSDR